jgi:hypothetical protein
MNWLGELPRSTSGPSLVLAAGDRSALTMMMKRSRAIGPATVRPFLTAPSLITGSRSGVVAQATKL